MAGALGIGRAGVAARRRTLGDVARARRAAADGRALGIRRTALPMPSQSSARSQAPQRHGTAPCSWRRPGSCCSPRRRTRRGRDADRGAALRGLLDVRRAGVVDAVAGLRDVAETAGRRDTSLLLLASPGQALPVPSQASVASQTPAEARQVVRSQHFVRRAARSPSHVSATSQTPAEARHSAVLLASAGQAFVMPRTLRRRRRPRPRRGTGTCSWHRRGTCC